jgi:hypothetical protein
MEIKDILGIGKVLPIDKLIDLIAKATGTLTKSYFDKKDVDTKVYEIREVAKAKADALKIMSTAISENAPSLSGIEYTESGLTLESIKQTREQYIESLPSPNLLDRTQIRLDYQEAKKQINIESVTAFAAEELKNEPPVTDSKVDEDWASRFFKYVEDVSDEEMQSIWGKILAGEIKQPNTYALRTLELLRNITKHEAEVFSKAANHAIMCGNDTFLYKSDLDEYGLDYSQISILREIGIIQEGDLVSYNFQISQLDNQIVFTSGNVIIIVRPKSTEVNKSINIHLFTQVGKQLLKLISVTPNNNYLNSFGKLLNDDNTKATYAYILSKADNMVVHTQPTLEFPM